MSDKNNSKYAVEMRHVSKIYTLKTKDKNKKKERFYALKDISFQVEKGDVVGILGTNGSGKSTLSLILSGISEHDGGEIIVNGEQTLISINTGLNQQLTGEENINVKGALMGFSKKRIQEIKERVCHGDNKDYDMEEAIQEENKKNMKNGLHLLKASLNKKDKQKNKLSMMHSFFIQQVKQF